MICMKQIELLLAGTVPCAVNSLHASCQQDSASIWSGLSNGTMHARRLAGAGPPALAVVKSVFRTVAMSCT